MPRGKGSQKHKTMQRVIEDMLREMGYLVIIEPAFDGRNADLLVQDMETLRTTIIEIELHKNYHHAIQSIRSDLRFCNDVIVFCKDETIIHALDERSIQFGKENRRRIHFLPINHYVNYIRTLFQNKNNNKSHNKTQNKTRIMNEQYKGPIPSARRR
jgi:hypothetical protein